MKRYKEPFSIFHLSLSVRVSGRVKIAQRFIAGIGRSPETKSVKRRAEKSWGAGRYHAAVRFTDYKSFSSLSQLSFVRFAD
jgi:hypothetical protein